MEMAIFRRKQASEQYTPPCCGQGRLIDEGMYRILWAYVNLNESRTDYATFVFVEVLHDFHPGHSARCLKELLALPSMGPILAASSTMTYLPTRKIICLR